MIVRLTLTFRLEERNLVCLGTVLTLLTVDTVDINSERFSDL